MGVCGPNPEWGARLPLQGDPPGSRPEALAVLCRRAAGCLRAGKILAFTGSLHPGARPPAPPPNPHDFRKTENPIRPLQSSVERKHQGHLPGADRLPGHLFTARTGPLPMAANNGSGPGGVIPRQGPSGNDPVWTSARVLQPVHEEAQAAPNLGCRTAHRDLT